MIVDNAPGQLQGSWAHADENHGAFPPVKPTVAQTPYRHSPASSAEISSVTVTEQASCQGRCREGTPHGAGRSRCGLIIRRVLRVTL